MTSVLDWIAAHDWIIASVAFVSVLTFVGTLVAIPIIVARMNADYFVRAQLPPQSWRLRHPVAHRTGWLFKNVLGAVLLLMGMVMLVLPGQGILTILIGVSLLDFPGKRRIQLRLARQRQVRRAIAWMRRRAGRPPLNYPDGIEDAPANPRSS